MFQRPLTWLFLLMFSFQVSVVEDFAYDTPTHSAISYWSLRHPASSVNTFLKSDLLWPAGIDVTARANIFPNDCGGACSLARWLELGAEAEDQGHRPLRHFYDPLANRGLFFPNAGGSVASALGCQEGRPDDFLCMDSLSWMWNGGDENGTQSVLGQEDLSTLISGPSPTRLPSNLWGWRMARYYYLRSLLSSFPYTTNPSENRIPLSRSSGQAYTFYALGHVIHLLQDLAQPQHTRNDAHLHFSLGRLDTGGIGLTDGAPFESRAARSYGTPEGLGLLAGRAGIPRFHLPSSMPQRGLDDLPRELRAFWDTGMYDGGLPSRDLLRSSSLGLAEFSNAYFVTDDTLPADPRLPDGSIAQIVHAPTPYHTFPHPTFSDSSIRLTSTATPARLILKGQVPVEFTSRPCGVLVDYESNGEFIPGIFSYNRSPIGNQADINLCDRNYDAQLQTLLPKAIGYSTGLLEYFFRGRFEVRIQADEIRDDGIATCTLTITNRTTTEESFEGNNYVREIANYAANYLQGNITSPESDLAHFIANLRDRNEAHRLKGRELRKQSAHWFLLEEDPQTLLQFPISFDAWISDQNTNGFTGRLMYGKSFQARAKLRKGRTYSLVFVGTIGNEIQSAVAAKRFIF